MEILIKDIKMNIWGREFLLPVEYDCFTGETVTDGQIQRLKEFMAHPEWVEDAKAQVEAFCKEAVDEDNNNEKKDNVFSYVKPDYVYIRRKRGKRIKEETLALMCRYRYDPEHGLAIVFSEGKITIGIQDIIL